MISPNLDHFYINIDKSLDLLKSYMEIKNLPFIIKTCRLKPIEYFIKPNNQVILYKHWIDEFNNSFKIINRNDYNIIYNDLSVTKYNTNTDLYYGLNISKISKMSKLAHIIIGNHLDPEYKNMMFVSFLGLDDYFRTFMWDGEWVRISPLILGLDRLEYISRNTFVKNFLNFSILEISPPCLGDKEWLCCLPAREDFLQWLQREYDLFGFLSKEQ